MLNKCLKCRKEISDKASNCPSFEHLIKSEKEKDS